MATRTGQGVRGASDVAAPGNLESMEKLPLPTDLPERVRCSELSRQEISPSQL